METRLKNCPFCGGEAITKHEKIYPEPNENNWDVSCQNENCIAFNYAVIMSRGGDDFGRYNTKKEAIEAWNTRKEVKA